MDEDIKNRNQEDQSGQLAEWCGKVLMCDISVNNSICLVLVVALITIIVMTFLRQFDQIKKNYEISQAVKINQQHVKPQLVQFRDFFDQNIKPTFVEFAQDYSNNVGDLQRKFRLSRQPQVTEREKAYIRRIFNKLCSIKKSQIYENIKINKNDTSYTIDKKNVYMCLNDNQPLGDSFVSSPTDIDVLVFVFLHECSHIACSDPDHSYDFWCIFRLILDVFCNYEGRVYKHLRLCDLNMEKAPIRYCNNMQITYNPLFDSNTYLEFPLDD